MHFNFALQTHLFPRKSILQDKEKDNTAFPVAYKPSLAYLLFYICSGGIPSAFLIKSELHRKKAAIQGTRSGSVLRDTPNRTIRVRGLSGLTAMNNKKKWM